MKVVGIIAEYNPFHNGHAYQIQKAKEITGADYVIVVMSGNYVQRGTPAIIDKFARTSMALKNGADLVFELPVLWSTASAEYFSMAGVKLLDSLGIVDFISFGCETKNFSLLTTAAKILAEEPEEFSALLKDSLKQGMTYPAAREKALFTYLKNDFDNELHEILSSPNNILAIEYCKAIYSLNSNIQPCPILRTGAGYHETDLHASLSSASALRKLLFSDAASAYKKEVFQQNIPSDSLEALADSSGAFLHENDFSSMLYYKLFLEQEMGFEAYGDSSPYLSNRIVNLLDSYLDFEQFCTLVKTKDVTHTRIRRLLLHILLNIRQTDYLSGKELQYIPWLRILGFKKESSVLLTEIRKKTALPMITKTTKAKDMLSAKAYALFQKELSASNLYYGTLSQKINTTVKNEFQRELVLL
ncbi:MAG: nucleotidyltransferase [Lachnospiraceae bacterium]|nr:nucleotidyltransferase [Lachnospiraceae bacterium]